MATGRVTYRNPDGSVGAWDSGAQTGEVSSQIDGGTRTVKVVVGARSVTVPLDILVAVDLTADPPKPVP